MERVLGSLAGRNPMKYCNSPACLLGLGLALMATAKAADAPPLSFKFTTINVPGAQQTLSFGINNSGVIVGQYIDQGGVAHGYVLNGKKLTTLDDPNGEDTFCYELNLNGAIAVVASYTDFNTNEDVAFLYKNGKFTDIPGPTGAIASVAYGINDRGDIVGDYLDSSRVAHGFLLKHKTYTTLDVPGAVMTFATGINNKGYIVLAWAGSKGFESSVYNGKTYRTIDVPGAAGSIAGAINTAGDVAYDWFDFNNVYHGALRHRGKYYKFDHPKSAQTLATGINDRHVIVGWYQNRNNGPTQGFKATYK
jgi:uncharacterized membrane protein